MSGGNVTNVMLRTLTLCVASAVAFLVFPEAPAAGLPPEPLCHD